MSIRFNWVVGILAISSAVCCAERHLWALPLSEGGPISAEKLDSPIYDSGFPEFWAVSRADEFTFTCLTSDARTAVYISPAEPNFAFLLSVRAVTRDQLSQDYVLQFHKMGRQFLESEIILFPYSLNSPNIDFEVTETTPSNRSIVNIRTENFLLDSPSGTYAIYLYAPARPDLPAFVTLISSGVILGVITPNGLTEESEEVQETDAGDVLADNLRSEGDELASAQFNTTPAAPALAIAAGCELKTAQDSHSNVDLHVLLLGLLFLGLALLKNTKSVRGPARNC